MRKKTKEYIRTLKEDLARAELEYDLLRHYFLALLRVACPGSSIVIPAEVYSSPVPDVQVTRTAEQLEFRFVE